MLDSARHPVCVLPCHTLVEDPAQRSMSDRKYSGSARDSSKSDRRGKNPAMRDHRHARSSADDPTISTTRSSKGVSSNARNHPRAELRDAEPLHRGSRLNQVSPVCNHVSSKANGGRKRTAEGEEEEGDVWVEHTSSSGRIYYYNKKNGVSQWEKPTGMSKRAKIDDTHTKHTTPLSSKHSSHPHSGSSHSHSSHTHSSSSSSHTHSHSHGGHRSYASSSSHHASHTSHYHTGHSSQLSHHDRVRERERGGHGSHRHSNRGSRSSSKSTSVSPTTTSRGRGHYEKTTPSRSSRCHGSSRRSVSPSVSSSKHTTPSTLAVSPCTPGIPHGISESLVATQQVINQTSAIIKHQQKLLSASGDPVTSMTSHTLSPTPTKHTSHPQARQKLLFTPTSSQQANGPSLHDGSNASATPVQNSLSAVAEISPQMIGMENLHPLQRALLLQQQQQQATVPEIPAGRSTPGTPLGGGATPLSQAVTPPISALPHHLVSHPSSPFSNSPSHTPFTTPPPGVHVVTPTIVPTPYTPQGLPPNSQTPGYTYPMPVMIAGGTPIAGIYMTDGGMPGGGGYVAAGTTVAMHPPMSRLGRRCSTSDEFSAFPDPARVESVASAANLELFSRSLAEAWWTQPTETMHKQLDSSQRELLSRRTTESLYIHGRLRRSQLSLESTRVRSTTRRERLLALEHLMSEIDQR